MPSSCILKISQVFDNKNEAQRFLQIFFSKIIMSGHYRKQRYKYKFFFYITTLAVNKKTKINASALLNDIHIFKIKDTIESSQTCGPQSCELRL